MQASEVLKAISHPLRLQILSLLCSKGQQSVGDLQEQMNIAQAVVSQHLKIMRVKGVLLTAKEGTQVFYRIASNDYKLLLKSIVKCNG